MIPKEIHYCWFGKQEKPEMVKKCISSWRKYCPDWKIIEWNEDNIDVTSVPYMKEAYENKKWAFVSDVARLLVIYQSGGIYLDTDVEILAPLNALLKENAFYCFESNRNIATGLGFGACKNHKSVEIMLDYYREKHFVENGKIKMIPCPRVNTEALKSIYPEFNRNGRGQKVKDIKILSSDEYSTIARHYGTATWVDNTDVIRKEYKDTKLKKFLRDPKRFEFLEKHFNKRIVDIYTFMAYDFLEMGLFYYLRRLKKRMKKV